MASELTRRQQQILEFISDYIRENSYPPTIREIGQKVNIRSLRGVTVHLDALQKKGYIMRGSLPRSIRVVHPSFQPHRHIKLLPVLGSIAAGQPLLAEQNVEQLIPVPTEMVKKIQDAFLLRIKGDSMSGEGIMPRDLVLIKPQRVASNNDLVAVLIGDEATVKRIQFEKSHIRLIPSNAAYEPIVVRGEEAQIIGKVVGLLRDYEGVAF